MVGMCTPGSMVGMCTPGSMVGVVLPAYHPGYHGGYTYSLLWYHPSTLSIPRPTMVRCCIRCHRSGVGENSLGSERQKPMGERGLTSEKSHLCERRGSSLRRNLCSPREERCERLDRHRVTCLNSPMVRHLCAQWCPLPVIRSLWIMRRR